MPAAWKTARKAQPDLGSLVIADLRNTSVHRAFLKELRDTYYFYVDDDRRTHLQSMGRVRRAASLVGWMLKSVLQNLSPFRRLMLLAAFVSMVFGRSDFTIGTRIFRADLHWGAFVILLFVLMLELKDKLLARDEIEVARQVQLALLPRRHPDVPGWSVWSSSRPANDVGGDLVDYLELDGFRHAVVLGDVAGKGLGAALLSAKLQATLRALVPDAASLDELGARVNATLNSEVLDNRYATLFYAQLEHHSGQLRYLNAGHNPPFIVRAAGVEKLAASSYPLGMLLTARYEEGSALLESGDFLLAYSDGLTEALNDRGEEFGVERVAALLPHLRGLAPEAAGTRMLEEVDRFIGAIRPADDLSLVVVVRQ